MHGEGFFFQAFVYLAAAVVSVPVAKRLGLGSVLGYLLAGVAIGPFGLHLVGEEGQDVMHFAEFGVVMMLFLVGLELEPTQLWRLRGPIHGLGSLQVAATTAVIAALSLALGQPAREAVAVGLILSMSSTAIVLQSLAERGLLRTVAGQSSFAVLLFQDLAVIPILALLPLLGPPGAAPAGPGHSVTWVGGLPAGGQTLAVLAVVGLVVLGARFLLRPVFRAIAATRLRELFTAAALLLVIGIALLMTRVGLSPALGTFLAGVVLANNEYRHELESDVEPFKGLLLGLFFIAVGASIDFRLVATQPARITALVVFVLAAKGALLFLLARAFRLGTDQALTFAFALPQVGEFAFVLLSFAFQEAVLGPETTGPLVAVVALSMAATPLLMLLNERILLPWVGTRERSGRGPDRIDEHGHVIVAGFGRFGSTVGRVLKANGVATTVLDNDSDRVELLRKLGLKVFYGDATRPDLLHSAGAERARLLVLALDSPERNLELVATARKHFPQLKVLARAADWGDAHELLNAGVAHVYRETLDASLRLGVDALRLLGFRAYQAGRAARRFLRHEEESMRELATVRGDRARYFRVARRRIEELERALLADLEDGAEAGDLGWDAESLREDVLKGGPRGR
jgi:monovalent cation:proton antiporter-2 (CPA2) family protein